MYKNKKLNNKKHVGADASVCPASKVRQKNGITLIALVITIIVMLILVAVTVSMAINGGLFEKAGEAVGDTKNELNKEQELANGRIQIDGKWYASIDDYLKNKPSTNQGTSGGGTEEGGTPAYADAPKDDQGFLTENAKYETAVVPKGFKVVAGIENTTTVEDGLVIQDKDGNEFVWIPVTFEVAEGSTKDANELYPEFKAVFYRSEWSSNARTTGLSSDYTEPYASGYTTENEEYYEMMRSVQENKGFYIGRYEAGIEKAKNPRTRSTTGTSNMVVQRDCYPYNFVGWGNAMNDYTSDVIYDTTNYTQTNGANMGKGALYLSKHMYDGEDIGAISTLCYGIQWDAMLDFIKDSSHNVTSSKEWGNYKDNLWTIDRQTARFTTSPATDTTWTQVPADGKKKESSSNILLTTGASDSFAAKNIYDVAGNVCEWTNEADSSDLRVFRSGVYDGGGGNYPASNRYNYYPYGCNSDLGFRPALYIKNS